MWVLVVYICGSVCGMSVVPGNYSTKEKCEAAVAEFKSTTGLANPWSFRGKCIPAPDDIVYE